MSRTVLTSAAATLAAVSLAFTGSALAATPAHPAHPAKTTTITLRATKAPTKGDHYKATLAALLRAANKPFADQTLTLQERKDGVKKWTATATTETTNAQGVATFSLVQTNATEQYQVVFAAVTGYKASHSGTVTVRRVK